MTIPIIESDGKLFGYRMISVSFSIPPCSIVLLTRFTSQQPTGTDFGVF